MAITAVLTGATSFLGQYLAAELVRNDVKVYAIIRPASGGIESFRAAVPQAAVILADMGQPDLWVERIRHADWFFHLGWDGIGAKGRADTVVQEKNISDAMRCFSGAASLGCKKFLFAGSQAEYGACKGIITENTACHPISLYGKAKYEVGLRLSDQAPQKGLTYYHARIFSVYGTGDHPWTLIMSGLRSFCSGECLKISSGTQYWNYLHVRDAAQMLYCLMQSDAPHGIYNIASKDTRRLSEFVEQLHAVCGMRGEIEFGSHLPSEKVVDLQPDISKILAQIGEFQFRDFQDETLKMACEKHSIEVGR